MCCLAVLYTRGEELLSRILKLVLGLVFVCGTVIVFSDIQPQGLSALQMLSACYANGVNAWLSGGAIGFVLGGVLLLLCGRPAANLIMIVLLLCGSLYIFDVTPAEVWVWLCAVTGGIHARGAAFAEQRAARRAERAPSGRQSGRSMRNTTKPRTSRWTRRTSLPGCIWGAGLDVRRAALGTQGNAGDGGRRCRN